MHSRSAVARDVWTLLEPLHAVVYFSPEPLAALRAAGYRGFWMGYFAGRAAPLGPVGPDVVQALFYNFAPARVGRALPAAWEFAPPARALEARLGGSVTALRRQLGELADSPDVATAADLAARAAAAAPLEGRPLFGANRALPEPSEPLARLWHAATLLREHRGDGHVAALLTSGVGGRESHVLHALTTGSPRDVYTAARDFADEEWHQILGSLRNRGLVDDRGAITAAGEGLKRRIEDLTDGLAAPAYDVLDTGEIARLIAALRPLARRVVAAGDLPLDSPMGLDLRQI